ncbi:hypothetical protein COCCADRAFT_33966 [Bipolaris zeicola 26-R-13]|uniref:Uncharacterized protein n=1 Tax=Cochliobolus carbonum (strain 26-R-13) TaxID=930089 RepID=W6YYS1_COCC2|nr:uncharacterized protein COCCADRAFT_33966 [Bipolaris zeicola 26-R-13]EUC36611.1 hypothetical protein COCCADRAFT_33966 [Bipolaris zeicola 26-R-13]
MAVSFLAIFAGLIALTAAYLYVFGISPELKRKMERQALKTMGENKMSYMTKDAIDKVPASDQENIKSLKKGLGNIAGGATQNPLGEQTVHAVTQARDSASNSTKNVWLDWDTVQSYPKAALDRVSAVTNKTQDTAQYHVPKKAE